MRLYSVKMRASKGNLHISGAETIVGEESIESVVAAFVRRALNHSRGKPDFINLKVEELKEEPLRISLLPVFEVSGNYDGSALAKRLLSVSPIGGGLAEKAFDFLLSGISMRGASVVDIETGERLEPDKERGIRASYLGMEKELEAALRKLAGDKFTVNFKEALLLSSKMLYFPDAVAEICISDNPDYTTGYVAFRGIGYFRIFNIKPPGKGWGGRVVFISNKSSLSTFLQFVEKKPVIADRLSSYSVVSPLDAVTLIEEYFSR